MCEMETPKGYTKIKEEMFPKSFVSRVCCTLYFNNAGYSEDLTEDAKVIRLLRSAKRGAQGRIAASPMRPGLY